MSRANGIRERRMQDCHNRPAQLRHNPGRLLSAIKVGKIVKLTVPFIYHGLSLRTTIQISGLTQAEDKGPETRTSRQSQHPDSEQP